MEYTTPSGFRDVLSEEARLREELARRVMDLFDGFGYSPIETPTLERLDVMEHGGRVPATPFKFLDTTGQLVTLRPDVTLQVARMGATRLKMQIEEGTPLRLRYMQRVFRENGGSGARLRADVREKKQIGIECIGPMGPVADAEVISLFVRALETMGVADFTISVANVGVLRSLLIASGAPDDWVMLVLEAFHSSNYVDLDRLCDPEYGRLAFKDSSGCQIDNTEDIEGSCVQDSLPWIAYAQAISELARISGGREAIEKVRLLVEPLGCADALEGFEATYDLLEKAGLTRNIVIDFSVMSSFDYYTGMVFEAYAPGIGCALGSGGRYDSLLKCYGSPTPAAGFAFFLEDAMSARESTLGIAVQRSIYPDDKINGAGLTSILESGNREPNGFRRPLRIAVPKGSLNPDAIEVLTAAGLDTSGLEDPGRQLIIRKPGVEYIIVRPSDAPIFVETGAADCGICGEDSLIETEADVVELTDLRFGSCRFIVAQLEGSQEKVREYALRLGSIRVATKYPRIARAHFAQCGQQVEIVELRGNIELGPLTGMSECIVDITATGTTLRENNLVITDEVLASTARFFANKASFRTDGRIRSLAQALNEYVADKDLKVTAGGA